jgi:lipopolysaccharide export system protein LptA
MPHAGASFRRAVVIALLLVASGGEAWALKSDREADTQIVGDAAVYDDVRQSTLWTGNVVLTRGSFSLRADRLVITQDPQGYVSGTATMNPGRLARFRQQRDTPPGTPVEHIEGSAERIDYDGRSDVVKLIGNASFRRLRDERLADETQGRVIVFDNIQGSFTIEGGQTSADNPRGQVRAVLTPRNASAPAAPTAPDGTPPAASGAAGASAPAAALKPATELPRRP